MISTNVHAPTPSHVRSSLPSLDTIFDDSHDNLPTWARNKLDSLVEIPTSAPPIDKPAKMKTSASFDQPVRRSRAVWEPSTAMNFAIMDETESHHSDSRDSPVFAIQSPSLDEEIVGITQENDTDTITITSQNDNFEKKINPIELDYKIVENEDEDSNLNSSMASSALISPKKEKSILFDVNEKPQKPYAVDTSISSSKSENSFSFKSPTTILDSIIKLDCDMDNSFRRQSISARYIMTFRLF